MKFCNNKYIKNLIINKNECPLDVNINAYDPSNTIKFIKEK